MTTNEMLQALSVNGSIYVQKIAVDILLGNDTIESQREHCGDFLNEVFDGDYKEAFRRADNINKHAFLRFLIEKGDQEKADYLIKKNFFDTG